LRRVGSAGYFLWSAVRAIAATMSRWMVDPIGVVVFILRILPRSGSGGVGAVSLGLSGVVLGVPAVALLAVVGHFTPSAVGPRNGPVILAERPL
jgi:hypothetical protein